MRPELVEEINRLFHDLTADTYGDVHPEIFGFQYERLIDFLRKYLKGHFEVVLDIGSGTGFMMSVFKTAGSPTYEDFIMLDISLRMLTEARRAHPEALFINASSLHLPIKSESVDLLTANSVLHHLRDPKSFMREAHRVLKRGGLFFINHEPNSRFSKNSVLWYTSVISSWIVRNINPIKSLKRIIASMRGIKNPVYSKINSILIQRGLIEKPLPDHVISALIDYHSPTAGSLRRGVGIDPDEFSEFFEVVHLETYAHLGKVSEKYRIAPVRFFERVLKKRYPLDGSKITAILLKRES